LPYTVFGNTHNHIHSFIGGRAHSSVGKYGKRLARQVKLRSQKTLKPLPVKNFRANATFCFTAATYIYPISLKRKKFNIQIRKTTLLSIKEFFPRHYCRGFLFYISYTFYTDDIF
jgi:hypothetical protein